MLDGSLTTIIGIYKVYVNVHTFNFRIFELIGIWLTKNVQALIVFGLDIQSL